MFVAKVGHECMCKAFSRQSRLYCIHWALQVLTSFHLPLTTIRGLMTSLLPIALALCRPEMRKVNRVGTKSCEFRIGVLRTMTNSDQLTVSGTVDALDRLDVFSDIPNREDFRLAARNTSCTAAGEALLDERLLDVETICDALHLEIATEASDSSRGLLTVADWPTGEFSPCIRKHPICHNPPICTSDR